MKENSVERSNSELFWEFVERVADSTTITKKYDFLKLSEEQNGYSASNLEKRKNILKQIEELFE